MQINKTTEVQEVSVIETTLAKQNITNQVIEKLRADYLGLEINGIDDKVGFNAVEEARKDCKRLRVLTEKICKAGREEAIKIQKDWIAKEKEISGKISEVEDSLSAKSDAIKEEEKRILFEAAQKAKLPARKEKLMSIGIEVPDEELLKIDDSAFNALFNEFYDKHLAEKAAKLKAEEERIAKEKADAEAKAKADAEALAKKQAEEAAEAKRLKDLEEAKEKARVEEQNKAKAELEQKERERVEAIELAEKQRIEAEQKAKELAERVEREKQEAIEKAEQEKQQAIENAKKEFEAKQAAELQAKKDAEDKADKERIAAEKKAAKAPDKEKLKEWINSIQCPSMPVFKSSDSQDIAVEILAKFGSFKKWANEQINAL